MADDDGRRTAEQLRRLRTTFADLIPRVFLHPWTPISYAAAFADPDPTADPLARLQAVLQGLASSLRLHLRLAQHLATTHAPAALRLCVWQARSLPVGAGLAQWPPVRAAAPPPSMAGLAFDGTRATVAVIDGGLGEPPRTVRVWGPLSLSATTFPPTAAALLVALRFKARFGTTTGTVLALTRAGVPVVSLTTQSDFRTHRFTVAGGAAPLTVTTTQSFALDECYVFALAFDGGVARAVLYNEGPLEQALPSLPTDGLEWNLGGVRTAGTTVTAANTAVYVRVHEVRYYAGAAMDSDVLRAACDQLRLDHSA